MKVVWSPLALQKLGDAAEFIARLFDYFEFLNTNKRWIFS